MAYDGWIEFNDVEVVNLSRTVQLSEAMGIDVVWTTPESVAWIEDALGGTDYDDVTTAPWYDAGTPASAEFAGFFSLGFAGLDDSTLVSTAVEYIGDGGHSGRARNATLPIVVSGAIIASTDRGAEFGLRWLKQSLRIGPSNAFCVGSDLEYFRYADVDSPKAHRRNVKMTRGVSVTRRRRAACSSTWTVTFTLTAADPFEYSNPMFLLGDLGSDTPVGPALLANGFDALTQGVCAEYDYSPVYDPLYPALSPAPTAPDFYPDGWGVLPGATFSRSWARIAAPEPSDLNVVPLITLTSDTDARMVRVTIWPGDTDVDEQCGPLFEAIVSYLPGLMGFIIDGEREASYVWDGFGPVVRRSDSLVFGAEARPVDWTAFNDPTSLLIALDVFSDSDTPASEVLSSVAFVSKTD